jgi:hypothetical protein
VANLKARIEVLEGMLASYQNGQAEAHVDRKMLTVSPTNELEFYRGAGTSIILQLLGLFANASDICD